LAVLELRNISRGESKCQRRRDRDAERGVAPYPPRSEVSIFKVFCVQDCILCTFYKGISVISYGSSVPLYPESIAFKVCWAQFTQNNLGKFPKIIPRLF